MKQLLLIFACCICIYPLFAELQRPLLITGCGRSGTGYVSQVFRQCGYEVLHEQIGAFGTSSREMTFESTWVPWGAPRNNIKFEHVFHQVRHPLDTISSMYATNPLSSPSWIYIFQMIPEMTPTDSLLTTCVKYWYYWNIHAEEQAELTYRVEAIADVWEDIEWILGITLDKSVSSLRTALLRKQYESQQALAAQKEEQAKRTAKFNEHRPIPIDSTITPDFEARYESSLTSIEEVPGS